MVRFNQALDACVELANTALADFTPIYIIRDVVGRVSIAIDAANAEVPNRRELAAALHDRLGAFSPGPEDAVQTRDALLIPEEVFGHPEAVLLQDDPVTIRLVDRLLTNQDWLRPPLVHAPPLPTAVAYSLKGGVGRSTTFAAWAWHLADRGRKVLAVDLDLEAPGLQSLLLQELPAFGMVDWLVEAKVNQADDGLFEAMLGRADLPPGTPGEVYVIPAFGADTQDYVAKLGRAYLPILDEAGRERGFADFVLALLQKAAARAEPFDAVLLDARAGLHDIGAAAVTRLGAEVFLFARDEPQTWAAYRHLFRHLRTFPSIHWGMPDNDLRWRLVMVAAQIGGAEAAFDRVLASAYSLWQDLYDEETEVDVATPSQRDEGAPHWPVPIRFLSELQGTSLDDPARRPAADVLERAFSAFFRVADGRLLGSEEESQQ